MSHASRRVFLQNTTAGLAALASAGAARAAESDGKLSVGLVGCGGRGTHDARLFAGVPGVSIDWLCDPDSQRLARTAKEFSVDSSKTTADMRRMLDDASVDAVIVATPDHWHAPAAILACNAKKHVYVEKPCSHNLREGRLLVEAARRNNRFVQHGTQVRSTKMMIDAVRLLREGVIGTVLAAKAWNVQRRGSIGRDKPSEPPAGFDYDLWVGPAPMIPYQANRVNSGWHWWYAFGTGDMGNDGVHDIDYTRWGLGVETHPTTIVALGGKYFFDDDQQFPDTQQVAFEYPGDGRPGQRRLLIYEQRLWSTNFPRNCDSGAEFYGTGGQMFLSRRGKFEVLDAANKRIEVPLVGEAQNDAAHVLNFCQAVRGKEKLNGDIEFGHLTTSLCHLGNVACRLGRSLRFDPASEAILGDDEAHRLLGREYRSEHWGTPRSS